MGDLHCVSLATGDIVWRRHLVRDFAVPKAAVSAAVSGPENVLVIGNGGRLSLYDVAEGGYRLNSTATVLPTSKPSDAKCPIYSHPAIVGTRLYIRGPHDLVCVDLASDEAGD